MCNLVSYIQTRNHFVNTSRKICGIFKGISHINPPLWSLHFFIMLFYIFITNKDDNKKELLNQTRPNSVCNLISTSTRRFMHRTIISFVQPQPNSIQNKNNPIGCGTAPGNLVIGFYPTRNHKVCTYLPHPQKKSKSMTGVGFIISWKNNDAATETTNGI